MRKHALRALAGLGLGAVFTSALLGGVVLHANLAGFRRAGTAIANRAMEPIFEGKIVVGGIDELHIGSKSRVRVHSASVYDPDGRRVGAIDGLDATINLRSLLKSIYSGHGPAVELENVRIDTADVTLDRDADGKPVIAKTFHPKPSTKKSTTAEKTSSTASEPYLDIASVRIGHAHVHGDLVPPKLDGTADDVVARVHLEHDVVRIDLDDGKVRLDAPMAPNQKQPVLGSAKGTLAYDIAAAKLSGHADVTGNAGAVPLVARAQMDGDDVDATVDVARIEVDPLGKAFSDLPFGRPIEVHAHAHGKLPDLAIDVRGRVGESDITAKGTLDLREDHGVVIDAEALHVEASAYGAPVATDITTKLSFTGNIAGRGRFGVTGTYVIDTQEGTIENQHLPPIRITGKLEEQTLTANVSASEPGLAVTGTGSMDLATFITNADVSVRSTNLRAITRVRTNTDGSANVRVQGKVNILAKTINATTTLHADGVRYDAFSAGHVDASGTLHGALDAPLLDVGFSGKDLQIKAKDKQPLVYPEASGHAQIAFVPDVRIVSASVDVGEKDSRNAIGATATNISIANGVIEARGVELRGFGEPLELDAHVGKGSWSVRAKGAGVDLHRVATVTGIHELRVLPEGTKASLDVDLHDSADGATGHADVVVTSEKGALLGGGIKLETHAKVDRGHVSMTAKLASEGLGEIEIPGAEVDLGGAPGGHLDAASIQRTTGVVELRGFLDLSQGGALLAGDKIEQMAGIASYQARIERGDPTALPMVRATVTTAGLDVTYSEDPAKPSHHIAGIDLAAHAEWDGRTDDAEVALQTWDHAGLLANASAKSKLPLAAWATGAQKLTRRAVADLNVNAIVDLPSRNVADLPAFLGLPELRGKLGAHLAFFGDVLHPTVELSAKASGLRAVNRNRALQRSSAMNTFEPLDGVVEARWDGERGVVTIALDERAPPRPLPRPIEETPLKPPPVVLPDGTRRAKRLPGHLHGLVTVNDARMSDLLRGRAPAELPWTASGEIEVQDLNLAALPLPTTSATRQITGALTGRFRVRELNRSASMEAQANITDFGIGGAQVQSLALIAGGRDQSLFVNAHIVDSDSTATLQLASQSPTVNGLQFDWDPAKKSRLDYAVQNARLGIILPIVRRSISEIDGRINGTGSITLDGQNQVFEGGLALTQTNLYVNTLGEQISGLSAVARFERSGMFAIDGATGKLGSGEFKASARGMMKGFQFSSAAAQITAAKEGIPISSEGANFASAAGEVNVTAQMTADRSALEVKLAIPRADVTLPDRSTQQLQSIDPDKTIDIGVRKHGKLDTTAVKRGRGGTGRTQVATTTASFATKVEATLGERVHLEGRGLDIMLGGKTYVQIANEIAVTGQLDLRGGTIEVHGRRFNVDRGIVTFAEGGDPANPSVVAAAYWDAPDRTRVWVEFAGPLKSGTLTLRSEPAFSKNEILSILLFGQPDPNMAAGGTGSSGSSGGDASGATAVGTGFVAEDINRMLSEIDSNLNYETDTLSGNRARTKLGRSFFDQRLKVQIGYAPGQTYREPDTTYLLLNWQFIPKWSLLGTAGDRGTSILDVLWQHRY